MGNGDWSSSFYKDRESERKKRGESAFAYHATVSQQPEKERKVHASMDPKGVLVRESRDSAEHPESNAIAVIFDVTGSMQTIPQVLQTKLPALMDTLNSGSYIPHPQLLFGAVGDEFSDQGSLQVGQFESDNRVSASFDNMWLEGKGGGGIRESYQNAIYFAARHTSIDCWEKRQKKGYLFLIGDELPYEVVSRSKVASLMGEQPQEDIPTEVIIQEAQEKYHIFFLIPLNASKGRDPQIQNRWRDLLGPQHVILIENADSVCETISMIIGVNEQSVTLDGAREALQAHGSDLHHINMAAAALSHLGDNPGPTTRL